MFRISYIFFLLMLFVLNIKGQAQDTVRQREWPIGGASIDEATIEWQQDIYLNIDLAKERNAGLYSDNYQEERTSGLFARIFELAIQKKISLYKYEIDGNERLTKKNQTDIVNILKDFHITYQAKGDTLIINKSDVPYTEVKAFYLKESIYYDAINSSFSRRVRALCPVIVVEDEMTAKPVRYPLFWVDYTELEKYIHSTFIISDYRNIAEKIALDEYFALNIYDGEIYKIYNAYGNTLSLMDDNDSTVNAERMRIKKFHDDIVKYTYNIYYKDRVETSTKEEPKVKVKYNWIFPWQKKKMQKALGTKDSKDKSE